MKRRGFHPFIKVGSLETSGTMVIDLPRFSSWIQKALSVEQHTAVRAPPPLLMVQGAPDPARGWGHRGREGLVGLDVIAGKLERLSMPKPPTPELQISGS